MKPRLPLFRAKRALGLAVLALGLAAPRLQAKTIAQARQEVLVQTLRYLNIPYLWGGVQPATGLDCSAFVQLVYRRARLFLPRSSREQFAATRYLKPQNVLPGDLVFFAMRRSRPRDVDHVGIYLGKGLFIHASVSNGVHIESIVKPYYMERLVSIRRYAGF
ncbi:MAG: C40 family peptidase [Elusimicrobia bacterium]|nr:C40 family peptidase [Elusimicrobiota bacterium]MDE2313633.1 C40 family peptidase [Elusimicrobiota bacterium]